MDYQKENKHPVQAMWLRLPLDFSPTISALLLKRVLAYFPFTGVRKPYRNNTRLNRYSDTAGIPRKHSCREKVVCLAARLCMALLTALLVSFCAPGVLFADEAALWGALRSGNHFVLLRHAIAPGMGDPPHFKLGECATQRNLSAEGRKQAEEIGERFRANGIEKARVFSSQWCRCLETAKLLKLGPVRELPPLNSFFERHERQELQTRMLKEWLAGQDFDLPLVLVSHQVNITALTNFYPASGELVVVGKSKDGAFSVAGSIQLEAW